jgi:uncharacterized protein (DUF362 family)
MGPLRPSPKAAGLVIAGQNPAYVDAAIARIMGYNIARIPTAYNAIYNRQSRLAGPDLCEFSIVSVAAGRTADIVPFDGIQTDWFVKPCNWKRADVQLARERSTGAESRLDLATACEP